MKQSINIHLRKSIVEDLDRLFTFQLDEESSYLAAFMPNDHTNKNAYLNKFTKLLQEPTVNNQTIFANDIIVGSVAKFEMGGEAEITYWIDRKYWGLRIASRALKLFLEIETTRPITARVAFDNFGSQKVLEKCGFMKIGTDKGYASTRQSEIEEYIYKLTK